MSNRQKVTCDICGYSQAEVRRVAKTFGKHEKLLVIENVPIVSCPHCGESYMAADTMHEIERIKLHRKSFAVERPVSVAEYA